MFKIGDKAYFSEDTLRRVRKEDWEDQGMYWSPYGLTERMAERIMEYDYVEVEGLRENSLEAFRAMNFVWSKSWFKEPVPNGLEGAVKLV